MNYINKVEDELIYHLSIIDLLFNLGPASTILKRRHIKGSIKT